MTRRKRDLTPPEGPPNKVMPPLPSFLDVLFGWINFRTDSRLDQLEATVSNLASHLDALETAVAAAEARDQQEAASINDLKSTIADLQAKLDAGTATDAEIARLDDLTARISKLDADAAPADGTPPAAGTVSDPDANHPAP